MVIKGISKTIIASIILASGMATAAYAKDVSCPDATEVKGAYKALNGVIRQGEKSCCVLSAGPAFEDDAGLGWILLTQTQANSFDPAFTNGTSDVKSVMMSMSDTPMEMQGLYICAYMTSSGGMNVMAAAQMDQGGDNIINPLKIKWDAIKFKK